MKLLFATGNNLKYSLMVRRLKDLSNIEVVMPKQLGININVNENGITAEEKNNRYKKIDNATQTIVKQYLI